MASKLQVTKTRRRLVLKKAGRKNKRQRVNKGTTTKLLPLLGSEKNKS